MNMSPDSRVLAGVVESVFIVSVHNSREPGGSLETLSLVDQSVRLYLFQQLSSRHLFIGSAARLRSLAILL